MRWFSGRFKMIVEKGRDNSEFRNKKETRSLNVFTCKILRFWGIMEKKTNALVT